MTAAPLSLSLAGISNSLFGVEISLASLVDVHLDLKVDHAAKKVFVVLQMIDWECRVMAFFSSPIVKIPIFWGIAVAGLVIASTVSVIVQTAGFVLYLFGITLGGRAIIELFVEDLGISKTFKKIADEAYEKRLILINKNQQRVLLERV